MCLFYFHSITRYQHLDSIESNWRHEKKLSSGCPSKHRPVCTEALGRGSAPPRRKHDASTWRRRSQNYKRRQQHVMAGLIAQGHAAATPWSMHASVQEINHENVNFFVFLWLRDTRIWSICFPARIAWRFAERKTSSKQQLRTLAAAGGVVLLHLHPASEGLWCGSIQRGTAWFHTQIGISQLIA